MRDNSILEFKGITVSFLKCIISTVFIFLVVHFYNIMPVHAGITFPDGQVFEISSKSDPETSIKINGKLINSGKWKAVNGDMVLVGEKGIMFDPMFAGNKIRVHVKSIRKKIAEGEYEILGHEASYEFKESDLGSKATIDGVVAIVEKQNGTIGLRIEGTTYFTNQYISKIGQKIKNNTKTLNIYDINNDLIKSIER